VLQLAQLRQVRDRHARELALPLVVRRLAHAVLPARLADLRTHLDFLEDADYLRFTESGFLHVETPSGGILYLWVVQVFEGPSGSTACRPSTAANSASNLHSQVVISQLSSLLSQTCSWRSLK